MFHIITATKGDISLHKINRLVFVIERDDVNRTIQTELYGEVNSVQNTTINIRLNDGVYCKWKKLHVSAYSGHLQILTTFLLKEFYIICLNRVVMLRSHHHFTCFG